LKIFFTFFQLPVEQWRVIFFVAVWRSNLLILPQEFLFVKRFFKKFFILFYSHKNVQKTTPAPFFLYHFCHPVSYFIHKISFVAQTN
jgi:hypothetical protein